MSRKIIAGIIVVAIVVLIAVFFLHDRDRENRKEELNAVSVVLNVLPYERVVGERTVVYDRSTVPHTSRTEYTQMDMPLNILSSESPLKYIERYVENQLTQEHLEEYPSNLFRYSVSFYPFEDHNGISAFVRVMGLPDDSVGGGEDRFDFLFLNNEWRLEWYGTRSYCQRPGQAYWAPPGELCP
jgi:hypothetical protein